ncbi:uncharacterized protein CC84DRAFT_631563 [Paraphaeosphaeria sporulosa]|uniref:Uncharacterized protein n=1 Tax=Paraphaeosphaeria sporulosa TaxID=1460663 RepID=A0A177CJF4_9PLEO|nr:uncharacterized protein CC84DRAFT_631563 [Paraphaeosphaeria sporulosa]OAG06960.1 hypothetical protein CC84DRAFT_631563 [Paraphaeosphaeria sporulosa]
MVSQQKTPDQGRWAFVTTSPTTRCPTAAQRTLMRKHIMKDIGYSRRACHYSSRSSSVSGAGGIPGQTDGAPEVIKPTAIPRAFPSTATALVTVNDDARCVLHYVFSDALPSYIRVYREKWYPVCVQDNAAFHQMLACCATHLYRWQPEKHHRLKRVAISEHAQALTIAREHLRGVTHLVSEDYLVVILMFACYAHMLNDLATFKMHMAAIRNIVSFRTSDISEEFMRLYQSIDSIGSYAFGITPSSLIPTTMTLPTLTHSTLGKPLSVLISSLDLKYRLTMLQAYQSLQNLDHYLALVHVNPGSSLLDEPYKLDLLVEPVSRCFLSLRIPTDMPAKDSAPLTYLCAGGLLYLAELRRRSGISPVMTTFHVDKLKQSLESMAHYLNIDPSIHLWVLTVGALESTSLDDQYYFCSQIKQLRTNEGIETMKQYEEHLHWVVWFDPLYQTRLSALFPMT